MRLLKTFLQIPIAINGLYPCISEDLYFPEVR